MAVSTLISGSDPIVCDPGRIIGHSGFFEKQYVVVGASRKMMSEVIAQRRLVFLTSVCGWRNAASALQTSWWL